ncbi:hypothetical protein ACS0TY_014718 [Phlomoides rotata]
MLSLIYKEMKEMREQDTKVNEYMKSNSNQIKNMEFQIGQLATTVGIYKTKENFLQPPSQIPKSIAKLLSSGAELSIKYPNYQVKTMLRRKPPRLSKKKRRMK